jgi:hypothetical protein
MSIDAIFAGFNASNVQPLPERGPVPAGWYRCGINETTNRSNKAGTGSYLEIEFEVLDGEFAKRRIWDRLNLDNPNQTAVEIAMASLSAICHAVGVLTPKSPEELKDQILEVQVAVQPAKGSYGESNVVKGYRPPQGAKPKAKAASPAAKALSEPTDDLPF